MTATTSTDAAAKPAPTPPRLVTIRYADGRVGQGVIVWHESD